MGEGRLVLRRREVGTHVMGCCNGKELAYSMLHLLEQEHHESDCCPAGREALVWHRTTGGDEKSS